MEAKVVARMKGGVSCRTGSTVEGTVMMWWVSMKAIRLAKVFWKASRSLSGAGWMLASSARALLRGLGGVDFFGDAGEFGLVFVKVVEGDGEEVVERNVDHLVVAEFFAEGVGAQLEVAVGAGEEIGLEPCTVGLEGVDDCGVGYCEGGLGFGIGGGIGA